MNHLQRKLKNRGTDGHLIITDKNYTEKELFRIIFTEQLMPKIYGNNWLKEQYNDDIESFREYIIKDLKQHGEFN